eukprot:2558867-Pleurochrysis_carterae.AAC.1
MAARFGIRLVDLKRFYNAPYYFCNVAMYLSGDKYDELTRYLASTFAAFNGGFQRVRTELRDAQGCWVSEAKICVACDESGAQAVVQDGGDAAAANAMGGLEPPPSREGCCTYYEERRTNWLDRAKTQQAQRRNLERSSRSAHLIPPDAQPGDRLLFPHCGFSITAVSTSRAKAAYEAMSDGEQTARGAATASP